MNREVDLRPALAAVRAEKKMKRTQNAVVAGQAMSHQGLQVWRPKATAQCISTDAGGRVLHESSPASDITRSVEFLTTVFGDDPSSKLENANKVSTTMEVNQAVIQSIKAKRYSENCTEFILSMHIRNKLKRKIEAQSDTSLSISKDNSRLYIVIEGLSSECVEKATSLLQALIEKKDNKGDSVGKSPSTKSSGLVTATKRGGSGALQWMPKAVRAMGTAADDSRDVIMSNEVEANDDETISGSIQVDKKLLRLVKGHKNEVKERIEKETNTTIRFGNPIVVEGSSEESVRKALEEIQRIVEDGVNDTKFQYSHFISLPLSLHPELVKKLEAFQESVLLSLGLPLLDEDLKSATADAEVGDPTAGAEQEATGEPETENLILEKEHTSDEAALEDAFRQSVLGSLGIQPNEEENLADNAFKEAVLSSLNIPAREEPGATEADKLVGTLTVEKADTHLPVRDAIVADETVEPLPCATDAEEPTVDKAADTNDVKEQDENATELSEVQVEAQTTTDVPEGADAFPDVPLTVKNKDCGVEKSIFIKPTRFHLTILMLKLWNEERVEQAREVLKKCLPDVVAALDGRPVSVSLKGLDIMRGSPKNTRVLFAKVTEADGQGRLSNACQIMINAFVESGLVLGRDRDQELKMHATVMNTSHRRSKSRFRNKGFDATDILAKFGDENWGDYQIMEAHLSERFKYDEDGYYHCCGSIPFPGSGDNIAVPEIASEEE